MGGGVTCFCTGGGAFGGSTCFSTGAFGGGGGVTCFCTGGGAFGGGGVTCFCTGGGAFGGGGGVTCFCTGGGAFGGGGGVTCFCGGGGGAFGGGAASFFFFGSSFCATMMRPAFEPSKALTICGNAIAETTVVASNTCRYFTRVLTNENSGNSASSWTSGSTSTGSGILRPELVFCPIEARLTTVQPPMAAEPLPPRAAVTRRRCSFSIPSKRRW